MKTRIPERFLTGLVVGAAALLLSLVADATPSAQATNTWTFTGDLSNVRANHTATVLQDGRVLVVGGTAGSLTPIASVELYDPDDGTWSQAASLLHARYQHDAVLLNDGRVLAIGGQNEVGLLSSVELYDPIADNWSPAADLGVARYQTTATLLSDGTVLVVGGWNGTYLSSTERYDPATNVWTTAASLTEGRLYHTATLLPDGDVLVVGGSNDGDELATVERFNLAQDTWSSAGALPVGRLNHTATLLADGTVLVAGGSGPDPFARPGSQRYLGGTAWTSASTGPSDFLATTSTLLPSGLVLITGINPDGGGVGLSKAFLYYPVQNSFNFAGFLDTSRRGHTASLLANGRLIVAGGATRFSVYLATTLLSDVCGGDVDCDGFGDPQQYHYGPTNNGTLYFRYDNCFDTPNAGQENFDGNFSDNSPPFSASVDDKTWADSDAAGDACDADDDNDGLSDAVELGGPPCVSATLATDPMKHDSDGDRYLDGIECSLETDPASAASKPLLTACGPAGDADGDKLSDRIEVCMYGTDPANTDTDGDRTLDGARDGCEAASFNGDRIVNVADMGMLASAISNPAFRIANVDVNKDEAFNPADQGLVASFISPSGQCPG